MRSAKDEAERDRLRVWLHQPPSPDGAPARSKEPAATPRSPSTTASRAPAATPPPGGRGISRARAMDLVSAVAAQDAELAGRRGRRPPS